ncbi:TauD/TfdA family dioxygenase [Reyranella sp. CPCC 100927]|uniref:TauD/TfdA dioxygenase family protein n=1 Tax=Reyranella sp. CPCC 100927 TaxID=2599616 RepID=UPI0011B43451|nr:TauD/TfdA family dioxygenase [Reyranella sp. CPCC 100927]TWT02903.1 TauD/TfdA family dioxygenase [Reyranella sp. CPCC 100927]
MASIRPLSDALGCEITGIDLARDLDDPTFGTIEAALHEHLVAVLPGQRLQPNDFMAFARRFGQPEPHVIDQFHHPADANILILSNVLKDGEPIGLADAGTYFHTDYSYLAVPARCTMLYAIDVPARGAGTTFANQRRAWEDLPADTRARIDGLVCRHHYGNRDDLDEASRTAASRLSAAQQARMDWVRHPLVRRHTHTERPALYAVSGSSFGIEGMDDVEAIALLDDLKAHATHPRYRYTYDYRPGDVIIWDNAALLHAAPLVDMSRPRTLWRITIKDPGPTL